MILTALSICINTVITCFIWPYYFLSTIVLCSTIQFMMSIQRNHEFPFTIGNGRRRRPDANREGLTEKRAISLCRFFPTRQTTSAARNALFQHASTRWRQCAFNLFLTQFPSTPPLWRPLSCTSPTYCHSPWRHTKRFSFFLYGNFVIGIFFILMRKGILWKAYFFILFF